jgi:hypothetical protein
MTSGATAGGETAAANWPNGETARGETAAANRPRRNVIDPEFETNECLKDLLLLFFLFCLFIPFYK